MDKHSNASRQKRSAKSGGTAKRVILGFGLVLMVMITGIGCGFLTASMNTKPDLANDILPPASSQIYDINGNEIANVHAAENRRPVKIAQVPKQLQDAFVAVEDNRFYEHSVVDPRGILRKGYVLALDRDGVKMASAAGSRSGDRVQMMFADGTLKCGVIEVIRRDNIPAEEQATKIS